MQIFDFVCLEFLVVDDIQDSEFKAALLPLCDMLVFLTVCVCSLKEGLGMSDVALLFRISGLSFGSPFLFSGLFLYLVQLLYFDI